MKKFHIIIIAYLMLTNLLYAKEPKNNVGYKQVKTSEVSYSLYYPSLQETKNNNNAILKSSFIINAKPLKAKHPYPLVIISHGLFANAKNHYLTAIKLANNGYITAVIQHQYDNDIASVNRIMALKNRVEELIFAQESIFKDQAFRGIIDKNQTHAIGYSLGSYTVMAAAGIAADIKQVNQHCDKNSEEDEKFCALATNNSMEQVYKYFLSFFTNVYNLEQFKFIPVINGKLILVAPIGHGFDFANSNYNDEGVFIIAFEHDKMLPNKFHANSLFKKFDRTKSKFKLYNDASHNDFNTPFSAWNNNQNEIEVIIDKQFEKGAKLINNINNDIVKFLKK